jgi:DNA (cytosine-5)-methyltransferase 1
VKPTYRIPSMAEIRALPWNGFNAVSFFSGCGGSSLGYRLAGYRVLYANEFVDAARDCYARNKADYTVLDARDIRDVRAADVLDAIGLAVGDLDLMDGSPPCASFSSSGVGSEGWGKVRSYSDRRQRTDDLFHEFVRLLEGIQPRTFIAENVSGLIKGKAKGYFLEILKALNAAGYQVRAKLLDAQWLGVPQDRERLIFAGVRNDLAVPPAFPAPLSYRYTVAELFPDLVHLKVGGYKNKWERTDRPFPTFLASDGTTSPTAYLSSGGFVEQRDGTRRKLTIDEGRIVCSFPADFVLTGDFAQQWERMGRAVPPLMMARIAETVQNRVLLPLRNQGIAA